MISLLHLFLAISCVAMPWAVARRVGMIRYFSPLHLVAWFAGFGILLKTISYTVNPALAFYPRFAPTPGADMLGLIYLTLFIAALCLGYVTMCKGALPSHNPAVSRLVSATLRRRWLVISIAIVVSLSVVTMLLRARGVSHVSLRVIADLNSSKQIAVNDAGVGQTMAGLKMAFIVPKLVFVMCLAHAVASENKVSILVTTLLTCLMIGIGVITGDRFEMIELLLYGLITWVILNGGFSARAALVFGVALIALLCVGAIMTDLRLAANQGIALGATAERLFKQIVGSTYFLDLNTAVIVVDRVSADQALWGESYFWWTFGWVPRALWDAKPATDLGVYFKRDILGVATGGAFNVSGPGEAFINFRWAGVCVGFALGACYRWLEELTLRAQPSARYAAFLLYPLFVYPFVQATLQSSFSAHLVAAVVQLVLALPVIWLCLTRFSLTTQNPSLGGAILR